MKLGPSCLTLSKITGRVEYEQIEVSDITARGAYLEFILRRNRRPVF